MFKVTVRRPGHEPQVETIRAREFVIGRRTDHTNCCDLSIDSKFVSKRQARISRGLLVESLGVTNRTYVNGQAVERLTPHKEGPLQLRIGGGSEAITVEILDLAAQEGADAEMTRTASSPAPPPPPAVDHLKVAELSKELESERSKLQTLRDHIEKLKQRAERREAELNGRCSELSRELVEVRAEVARDQAAAQSQVAAAESKCGAFSDQLSELQQRFQRLESERNALVAQRIDEPVFEQLSRQLAAALAKNGALEQQLKSGATAAAKAVAKGAS